MSHRVAVVGAGMSGAACALALHRSGVDVDVYERGRAPGGRMASPSVNGRRVDLGAAYFTAKEPGFVELVEEFRERGLVRPWTDTFDVFGAEGHHQAPGPVRYATPDGLRALVRALLPHHVNLSDEVTDIGDLPGDAVVVAMPDPQAARLVPDASTWVSYQPVIAVALGFARRSWALADAAFVNDDPDLSFVADDGARRGDGAAVLVAHSTAQRAGMHLDVPKSAVAPVIAALRRVLDVGDEPEWTHVHRWTFAKPADTHGDDPFHLAAYGSRPLGLCGDSWCPTGAPRVESAWLSGHRLGTALAAHLKS